MLFASCGLDPFERAPWVVWLERARCCRRFGVVYIVILGGTAIDTLLLKAIMKYLPPRPHSKRAIQGPWRCEEVPIVRQPHRGEVDVFRGTNTQQKVNTASLTQVLGDAICCDVLSNYLQSPGSDQGINYEGGEERTSSAPPNGKMLAEKVRSDAVIAMRCHRFVVAESHAIPVW